MKAAQQPDGTQACVKRKFFSKQEAKVFMRTNNAEHRNEPQLTTAYKCLRCGNWHVTHLTKSEGRDLVRIGHLKDDSKPSAELEALRNHFKSKF